MKIKNKSDNGSNPAAAQPVSTPSAQKQKRMILSAITESAPSKSEKIVLYAPEGWGKSTWASNSVSPVFLSTEDGLKNIKAQKFPEPESWLDIFEAVDTLRAEQHAFKTLVIDTADWTEHLCQKYLLARDKKDSIEGYGFGKGYVLAFEEWKRLLAPIDALRKEKEMSIIFLAHSAIKTFSNPAGENYDRYELKTDKRIAALLKEWADCVLFGSYDVAVDVKSGQSKGKGYGGDRVIYANHTPAWDAKNRYGISEPIPCDFDTFLKITKGENQ